MSHSLPKHATPTHPAFVTAPHQNFIHFSPTCYTPSPPAWPRRFPGRYHHSTQHVPPLPQHCPPTSQTCHKHFPPARPAPLTQRVPLTHPNMSYHILTIISQPFPPTCPTHSHNMSHTPPDISHTPTTCHTLSPNMSPSMSHRSPPKSDPHSPNMSYGLTTNKS